MERDMSEKRTLKFSVLDVNGEMHEVTIEQEIANSVNLSAFCSCGEASDTDFCEHRYSILEGDSTVLASSSLENFGTLQKWVRGSDIEAAMMELSQAKTDLRLAMDCVDTCRKKLAKRMLD